MTASQFTADRQATAHSPWLADALDINDNGLLGWPDLMAWIFFGTVGVLVVAVVAGMALSGVALAAHGIRRMAYGVWALPDARTWTPGNQQWHPGPAGPMRAAIESIRPPGPRAIGRGPRVPRTDDLLGGADRSLSPSRSTERREVRPA